MRIAYLILAHSNPAHLKSLIEALDTDKGKIFIHIDGKSNVADFGGIAKPNVEFIESRTKIYWGDYSMVAATLDLMKVALSDETGFDYLTLISGADFPLRSPEYIKAYFEKHKGTEFMNMVSMPNDKMGKPISRLTRYMPTPLDRVSELQKLVKRAKVKSRLWKTERDYKAVFGDLKPYGGSSWWSLSTEACQYIIAFTEQQPKIMQFFKNSYNPDEMVFQTIIGNSPFKNKATHNLTYTDWSKGGPHPTPLTETNFSLSKLSMPLVANDGFGQGELLYARKFSDSSAPFVEKLAQSFVE